MKSNKNLINKRGNLFVILPILPQIIIIAATLALFHYVVGHDLFHNWNGPILIGVKVIVALQIIIGSARSLLMPILALIFGLLVFYVEVIYDITTISHSDAWQLIIMACIGFAITLLTKR